MLDALVPTRKIAQYITKKMDLYVIHTRELEDRARSFTKLVRALEEVCDVNMHVCNSHDVDSLVNNSALNTLVDFNPIAADQTPCADVFNRHVKGMHVNHISCAMKHLTALKTIAEAADQPDDEERVYMVIEDDCIVAFDDTKSMQTLVKELWKACVSHVKSDFLYLCTHVSSDIPNQTPDVIRRFPINTLTSNGFVFPTSNAYCVRPSYARALLPHLTPLKFAWNVQLSYALHRTEGSVGALEKALLLDGSKTGHFCSVLSGENTLQLNSQYNELNKLLTRLSPAENDDASVAQFIDHFNSQSGILKDHPDLLRIHATYLTNRSRHVEAHQVLHRAAQTLLRQPLVLINNQSGLMKDYIKSFAHVQ